MKHTHSTTIMFKTILTPNSTNFSIISITLLTLAIVYLIISKFHHNEIERISQSKATNRNAVEPIESNRPKITILSISPRSKLKPNETLKISGELKIPTGYVIFEKRLLVETYKISARKRVLLSSKYALLHNTHDSIYNFNAIIHSPNNLPWKAGRYKVTLVVSTDFLNMPVSIANANGSDPTTEPLTHTHFYEVTR